MVSTENVDSNFCLKEIALLTFKLLLPMVTVALRSFPVVFFDILKSSAVVFEERVLALLLLCRVIQLQSLGIDTL